MKKLKFNLQQLDNVEVLSREQLKTVLGGAGGSGSDISNCGASCETDYTCYGFCYRCGSDKKCYQPPQD